MHDRVIDLRPGDGRGELDTPLEDGFACLSASTFREVIDAVRHETETGRAAIHRLVRVWSCDLVLRTGLPGRRLVVTGDCPCRDFLMDMIVEAERFLAAPRSEELHNSAGAVRTHIRNRSCDWTRRRRASAGAQARTDRLRSGALGQAMPDEYHRGLLEYVAQEAGSLAPLGDGAALHRRLAELLAAEFDGSVADHLQRVPDALAVVERVCRAGRKVAEHPGSTERVTWWERYVDAPLGRRVSLGEVSLDADAAKQLGQTALSADAGQDDAIVALFLRTVTSSLGAGLIAALRAAAAELVRQELLPAAAARSFVEDPQRVREVAEQVRVLLAA